MAEDQSEDISDFTVTEIPEFNLEELRGEIVNLIQDITGDSVYDDRTKHIQLEEILSSTYELLLSKKFVNKYVVKVALTRNMGYGLTSVMSAHWDINLDQVLSVDWTNPTTKVLINIFKFNVL
ncbi:hypothetical protein M8J76_009525 [Diaphorina citri]|nr:hypothetical protein M8J75_016463 [Diaphorina citri]KAI5719390.1 hypothetical protein M8J76_009525 [Diaphorina citri]KAI5721143.1 hypothetical protein M8J77_016720 [Diaphorina citri]